MSETANPPSPVMPANPLPGFEQGVRQEIAFDLYDAVGTRDRLPPAQTEARNAAAFVMLNSLAPADPLQAMLASQAVALHYAAMTCFRRANETETTPDTPAPKLHHTAVRLITAFAASIHRLHTLQQNPIQPEPPAPTPSPPQCGGEGRGEVGNTPTATAQAGTQGPSSSPARHESPPSPPDPAAPDPRLRADAEQDASPARQDPMQRENPIQREAAPPPAAPSAAPPVAPAQAGAQEPPPDPALTEPPPSDPAALDLRLCAGAHQAGSPAAKHPLHREPPPPPPTPAPEPYFDWRNKTVLERFAHFFPERVAAHNGDAATAHAAWAAENEAEWARVKAARANANKPHAT